MKVIDTAIPDVKILQPQIFGDARGYFTETYNHRLFTQLIGKEYNWVQDNQSKSCRGVIRGLHFQRPPHTQAKLVRVLEGAVLDVAVDLRAGSPTYGSHVAVELTGENHLQLLVPRGFAHGFAVLSPSATFAYKCDNYYTPEAEGGIAFDDPDLNINWPIDTAHAILSEKDLRNTAFKEFITPF
ncbi:MAG: dTDP-4-dehydrorhamnose 3,5-epimerase [Muribaculaceae bacterium]|nr:dTDP-4-dehydrorhamnose 3,5-epimerase [Muribaculaceae bacterium]